MKDKEQYIICVKCEDNYHDDRFNQCYECSEKEKIKSRKETIEFYRRLKNHPNKRIYRIHLK